MTLECISFLVRIATVSNYAQKMSPMAYTALGRNPLNKRASKLSDAFHQTAAQQIVGRERRERVSQLAWCGEGCFDSRRRVNSTVIRRCLTLTKFLGLN